MTSTTTRARRLLSSLAAACAIAAACGPRASTPCNGDLDCGRREVCIDGACAPGGDGGLDARADGGGAGARDGGGPAPDSGASTDGGPSIDADAGAPQIDGGLAADDAGLPDGGVATADAGLEDAGARRFGDGRDGPLVIGGDVTLDLCRPLSSTSGAGVFVDDPAGLFRAGDFVLLHQVTGAAFVSGASPDAASLGDAGRFQVVDVVSVSASDGTSFLAVEPPPSIQYRSGDAARAHACLVRQHTDVDVLGALRAAPWNGSAGGVLALAATGTIRIDGTIDARGCGLRGGALRPDAVAFDVAALDVAADGTGGGKGESIDGASHRLSGRGHRGPGGGGGNAGNSGGGGGAGFGDGGRGGAQYSGHASTIETYGMGGRSPYIVVDRLFLGGGGGAGQQDQGNGGAGGGGGGAVILLAPLLVGAGVVDASGAPGASSLGEAIDGAGGGGGGGVIFLDVASSTFTGVLRARGGAGGDNDGLEALHGPGGGGGGGAVVGGTASGAFVDVGGGAAGVSNLGDDAEGAHGAEPGAVGLLP